MVPERALNSNGRLIIGNPNQIVTTNYYEPNANVNQTRNSVQFASDSGLPQFWIPSSDQRKGHNLTSDK